MSADLNSEPVIIPLSKLKLVWLLLIGVGFVAAGIWFVTNPSTFTKDGFYLRYNTEIMIVGYVAIIFFGALTLMIFRKLFDSKPGLLIDNDGITDNSSGVSAGTIAWADITGLTIQQVYSQKFILVLVKNPEEYIGRYASTFKRKAAKLNYQMYGSPITISTNSLKCDFDELYALLTERLKKQN